MTLIDRCKHLRVRITSAAEFHGRKSKAETIEDRRRRVSDVSPKVHASIDRAKVIREHGLPGPLPPCHAARVACREAAVIVRAAASSGTPEDLDDAAWRRLTTAVDQDAAALELAVREAVDASQKPVRDLQVSGFEAVAVAFGKEAQVTRLKLDRQSLLNESWHAKSATELRTLLVFRSNLLKAANELRDIDAPDVVKRFLDSARRAEATVGEFTPEVRSWLEQKGLLGQLRITLGTR